jgi:hypothetical protein
MRSGSVVPCHVVLFKEGKGAERETCFFFLSVVEKKVAELSLSKVIIPWT